jgi:Arm DNA-binding domain
MPLTNAAILNAKATTKPIKLADAAGLYLEVRPSGSRLWRYRYRIAGKENLFAAGEFFEGRRGETADQAAERQSGGLLTLAEARVKREEWRGLVKQHPSVPPSPADEIPTVSQQREHLRGCSARVDRQEEAALDSILPAAGRTVSVGGRVSLCREATHSVGDSGPPAGNHAAD